MIAASEEFLREIAPTARYGDGYVSKSALLAAAVKASFRVGTGMDWNEEAFVSVISERSAMHSMAVHLALASDWERKYDSNPGIGPEIIEFGMPFVGWAIGSESRRIDCPAQPGEGDFIKYLGRDPAPEEIGPCNFDRE